MFVFLPQLQKNPKKCLKQKVKAQKDYFDVIYHNKVYTYIFLIQPLLEARAAIQKYFRSFWVEMKFLKFAFEVY